jgi:hypothetical protein
MLCHIQTAKHLRHDLIDIHPLPMAEPPAIKMEPAIAVDRTDKEEVAHRREVDLSHYVDPPESVLSSVSLERR